MYDSIVSANSLNPLDELKFVDLQIDHVADLGGLKPIFSRVDEIGRLHSGDLEVQLAVSEIKHISAIRKRNMDGIHFIAKRTENSCIE